MGQKFYADLGCPFEFTNGAIGYRTGATFDVLGPYAKVVNCPIGDTDYRLTCYATGYADTAFTVPACTRIKGKHVRGHFERKDGAITFYPSKGKLPDNQLRASLTRAKARS